MTRAEFNEIDNFYDLIEVANDFGCGDYVSDIWDEDGMDSEICDAIRDDLDHRHWSSIKESLESIEDCGEGYYRRDGTYDWYYLTEDDLDSYKESIRDYLERNDLFDEEEGEDEPEPESYYGYYENPAPVTASYSQEPDFEDAADANIGELFAICNSKLQKLEYKPDDEGNSIDIPFEF